MVTSKWMAWGSSSRTARRGNSSTLQSLARSGTAHRPPGSTTVALAAATKRDAVVLSGILTNWQIYQLVLFVGSAFFLVMGGLSNIGVHRINMCSRFSNCHKKSWKESATPLEWKVLVLEVPVILGLWAAPISRGPSRYEVMGRKTLPLSSWRSMLGWLGCDWMWVNRGSRERQAFICL